jgi:hypothetical protein
LADVRFLEAAYDPRYCSEEKDPPEVLSDLEEDFPNEDKLVGRGHQERIVNHVSIM